MPTYDYMCQSCLRYFEVCHAIEDAGPKCPFCGGLSERRILSPPAVHGCMAQGRELAIHSLEPEPLNNRHAGGCTCCRCHND
ncbi:MAG TPA: zinc ribbon domain-containing protein [Gammaproteobacteria bacterium]|nr:zinc ribbon domain-containing protein [Gammaproteobacteria bacterium]